MLKNDGVNAISDKPGTQFHNEATCSWELPFWLRGYWVGFNKQD